MTPAQADVKLREIQKLSDQIEFDKELEKTDERYRILAKWIDTDIQNVSVD